MAERDIPHGHGLSHKRGVSDGLLARRIMKLKFMRHTGPAISEVSKKV
jgi:hypothetical protein